MGQRVLTLEVDLDLLRLLCNQLLLLIETRPQFVECLLHRRRFRQNDTSVAAAGCAAAADASRFNIKQVVDQRALRNARGTASLRAHMFDHL
jgi:hypothetical protein